MPTPAYVSARRAETCAHAMAADTETLPAVAADAGTVPWPPRSELLSMRPGAGAERDRGLLGPDAAERGPRLLVG